MAVEFVAYALMLSFGLFAGMVGCILLGRALGLRRMAADPDGAFAGLGAIDAAVYALLGLLIAFTFSGAASRFDHRRELIVEEANIIGTAYLRLDLLPQAEQGPMRALMRDYAQSRLDTYRLLPDLAASDAAAARALALQGQLWDGAVAGVQAPGQSTVPGMLILPALNDLIDIVTTRDMATQFHPPKAVWGMLFGMCLAAALVAGYGMAQARKPSLVHVVGFPLVMAFVVNLVLNMEHPRLGLIRVDTFDRAIADTIAGMD